MSIRSGVAAQLGVAAETTWGTYQTPTRFFEFNNENLNLSVARIESQSLRASNRMLRTDRWVANKKGVSGSVSLEVMSKNFGLVFQHMLGSISSGTVAGGTNAKKHTAVLGDPFGLGLTVQVGRPDIGGTVRPFSYLGCKVTDWEISNSVDGLLMLNLSLDGSDETTAQSLAAASYATAQEILNFTGGVLNVAGAAVDVRDVSIKGTTGQKTDRYFIRANTLKKEPVIASMVEISGSVTMDFTDLTAYNRFVNGTLASLDVTWTGATALEGAIFPSCKVTLNNVRFDGDTPNVSGPDVLTQTLNFKALYDGSTGPITIDYTTLDATP